VSVDAAVLRPLSASDSLEALTALLHRAYARLAAVGLNFTAVDQSVETTRARFESGQGFVLDDSGALVGCVVVAGPFDPQRHPAVLRSPWYLRRDVAHLHQLAIDPARAGRANRVTAPSRSTPPSRHITCASGMRVSATPRSIACNGTASATRA
jgi:hypothetical protein